MRRHTQTVVVKQSTVVLYSTNLRPSVGELKSGSSPLRFTLRSWKTAVEHRARLNGRKLKVKVRALESISRETHIPCKGSRVQE